MFWSLRMSSSLWIGNSQNLDIYSLYSLSIRNSEWGVTHNLEHTQICNFTQIWELNQVCELTQNEELTQNVKLTHSWELTQNEELSQNVEVSQNWEALRIGNSLSFGPHSFLQLRIGNSSRNSHSKWITHSELGTVRIGNSEFGTHSNLRTQNWVLRCMTSLRMWISLSILYSLGIWSSLRMFN